MFLCSVLSQAIFDVFDGVHRSSSGLVEGEVLKHV